MAHTVLTDAKIWVAEYDLAADMNAISCEYVAGAVDDTNFGDSSEVNLGGVREVAFEASGHIEESAISSKALFNRVGATKKPLSFAPGAATEGNTAYTFDALTASYVPQGSHGEAWAFDVSATGAGELVRGTIMVSPAAAITSSGNGTARQLGAVGATQKAYASLHVTSASAGDTLDVSVYSDDASGMASATEQITFTQVSGGNATSEHLTASGAITDDYWRVDYTIAGSDPSFTFIVVVGIK